VNEVAEARALLARYFAPSRLIYSDALGAYLKLESDLPTGTFKCRGAIYALSRCEGAAEVVAASTGNHGAAVAYAAKLRSIPATIFVPRGANPVKLERIARLGGTIREVGVTLAESIDYAADYAAARGAYFLHDASDPFVPIGTATIAAELMEQLPAVDSIYVPVGDTALIRGVAEEAKRVKPSVKIIGVQAKNAPAYYRSWQSGTVVLTDSANTIADGLATTRPLAENVAVIGKLVDEMVLVSEEELLDAIGWLLFHEHLVAEPAAAATVAAFLKHKREEGTPVLLITGCNLAPDVLRRAVTGPRRPPPQSPADAPGTA
jgi:threonine dehydratase